MLEWFCLGELWRAAQTWGPIRNLLGAVILVVAALELLASCGEITQLMLQR